MRATLLLMACAVALAGSPATCDAGQRGRGVEIAVRTPTPQRFEVALDEVEVEWRDERGQVREGQKPAAATSRTAVQRTKPGGTVFSVRETGSVDDLRAVARGLEEQNPGAVAYLVLYDAGRPRSEASRQLLGREVAVIFNDAAQAEAILSARSAKYRPLKAVAGAYVVEAADALGALALADELDALPEVETAYPLLRRQHFTR